jgi:hypothetical protein
LYNKVIILPFQSPNAPTELVILPVVFLSADLPNIQQTEIINRTSTVRSGADAIKKFTPSLGIPYLGV